MELQWDPADLPAAVTTARQFVSEGADQLLLEPALTCADLLVQLTRQYPVPLASLSVSGEYQRLDLRLLIEVFTMLKRAGAAHVITYAAADIARLLGG